jgi:hypothetical protein
VRVITHPNLNPPRINMKTARFLFIVIGISALTLHLSIGDQLSGQPSDKGSAENRIIPDSRFDHKSSKGADLGQADIIYPRVGQHLRPFEKSSQAGVSKNGVLPARGVLAGHRVLPGHGVIPTQGVLPANGVEPGHRPELNHPKPVANNHEVLGQKPVGHSQTKLPSVYDLHPTVLKPSSTAEAKDGLILNRTPNTQEETTKRLPNPQEELSRKSLPDDGANPSLPGVVHNRVGSTASIGQLMPTSTKRSTAALNGTGMKLKP